MRLLNVNTYRLEEYYEPEIPPYAILSHRWGSEEISFADLQERNFEHKDAFKKMQFTCEQAFRDGFEYVWIDTLSINKDSSTELSEAVNSMFRWYQNAAICYAFLRDVHVPENASQKQTCFTDSEWFRRGWTLQELIAPKKMEFFGNGWRSIGSRHSLRKPISKITRVDVELLQDDRRPLQKILPTLTVAKRMSWAACRDTSRVEDRAYSLIGLFGVNMPLLYGEGRKAFMRLQEEIMKTSTDLSIFAWEITGSGRDYQGQLLATNPDDFEQSSKIDPAPTNNEIFEQTRLSIINHGLRIENPYVVALGEDEIALSLECRDKGNVVTVLALRLCSISSQTQDGQPEERQRNICYVDTDEESRLVSVGFLQPNRLPQWSTLTIARGISPSYAGNIRYVREHTHIWVQLPPSTPSCPRWLVPRYWPAYQWESENLTFDLDREAFLEASSQGIEEKRVYGALVLQSGLGKVALIFSHRYTSFRPATADESDKPLIGSDIRTTLVPYPSASFPRGSQPKLTELDGPLTHSLELKNNHLLRVKVGSCHRYGLHIGHLELSLDAQSESN